MRFLRYGLTSSLGAQKLNWLGRPKGDYLSLPIRLLVGGRNGRYIIKHLHDAFGDVPSFVDCDDLPPTKVILNDPPKNRKLQMELAITVDVGEPFVKAT